MMVCLGIINQENEGRIDRCLFELAGGAVASIRPAKHDGLERLLRKLHHLPCSREHVMFPPRHLQFSQAGERRLWRCGEDTVDEATGAGGPALASKDSRELKSRASTYLSPKSLANAAGTMEKGRRTRNVEERIAGVLGRVCVEQTSCSNFCQRNGRRSDKNHSIYVSARKLSEKFKRELSHGS